MARSPRRNPAAVLAARPLRASPRTRLALEEAARVLDRPIADVRRAIRAGFLRAGRGGDTVTLGACRRFLQEEARDEATLERGLRRLAAGTAQLRPWSEVRRRL